MLRSNTREIIQDYLASLPIDVRQNLNSAYSLLQLPLLIAVFCGLFSMALDPMWKLSALVHSTPNTIFHYSPHPFLNLILPMPLVFLVTQSIVKPFISKLTANSQEEWNELKSLNPIFSIRYGRVTLHVISVLSFILILFNVNSYYMIDRQDICFNRLFATQRMMYGFDQLSSITQEPVTKNNSSKIQYYVYNIGFRNGDSIILSGRSMFEDDRQKLDEAMQYVSQQSNVPISP